MRLVRHFAGIGIAVAIALIPRAQAASGEIELRRGDFSAARQSFEQATTQDPGAARAWWGLGRIEELHSRRDAARDLFARAYRLDPRDPEILLSYLQYVSDPEARKVLLRNVIALSKDSAPERAMQAQARIEIESRLAGRTAGALASDYRTYRLTLGGFHPAGAEQRGWTVTARVNGSRPLRLVLDTGARGLLLHKSAARDLGLEPVVSSLLQGMGASRGTESTLSLARSVSFGGLDFRDCLMEVAAREVVPGADGIVGIGMFESFVVHIDPRTRSLDLTPRVEGALAEGERALNLDHLLLVRAQMAWGREGWFLLDTGAAFTAIGSEACAAGTRGAPTDLAGMQGAAGAVRLSPVALRVAGRDLAATDAVALDLSGLSRREGIEISGILGYSALSRWPVTIDLKGGWVRIGE